MDAFPVGRDTLKELVMFNLAMANRHGLIAGATGTGKTVTLQVLAENLSNAGVSVFAADVKGDLSGLAMEAVVSPTLQKRITALDVQHYTPHANPVVFWDLYGKNGHQLRTTISDMGPLLLGRLLELNDTQQSVLQLIFNVADDQGLLLLDMKDLRSMLDWVADNTDTLKSKYGSIPSTTLGTIQRKVITLASSGCEQFFGEPALNVHDLFQKDTNGKGIINILDATKIINDSRLYSTFLLWLLSELFEQLPEVGDIDKPKLVFFFDEAHLLFNEAPKVLMDKIEQLVRLIRSKGVGVYFITQSPLDVPETVLGQLSNRLQHALRAFTPKDQKAVKSAAQTFRKNPKLDVEATITTLGVGEVLVSFLDETGTPAIVNKASVFPPASRIGSITDVERQTIINSSPFKGKYDVSVDRESAYEILNKKVSLATENQAQQKYPSQPASDQPKRGPGRPRDTLLETVVKSSSRTLATQVGRQIVRGILGSIFGKK